mgnify:CR=1 FL=1
MSVTLAVFQLDMSTLKVFLSLKSWLMSVTFETPQLAMSVMSPSSAFLSSSLFAKVAPITTGIHHGAQVTPSFVLPRLMVKHAELG